MPRTATSRRAAADAPLLGNVTGVASGSAARCARDGGDEPEGANCGESSPRSSPPSAPPRILLRRSAVLELASSQPSIPSRRAAPTGGPCAHVGGGEPMMRKLRQLIARIAGARGVGGRPILWRCAAAAAAARVAPGRVVAHPVQGRGGRWRTFSALVVGRHACAIQSLTARVTRPHASWYSIELTRGVCSCIGAPKLSPDSPS